MVAPEYTNDGQKGGTAWVSKPSRDPTGECNSMLYIMQLAEQHDEQNITEEMFHNVVGRFMNPRKQVELQGAVWTSLGGCLSGSAETIFKKADP